MTTTQTSVLTELTSVRARHAAGTPKPPPLPSDAGAAASAGLPDLSALSDEALAALVEQGQAEITRRREKREADFLAQVAETARVLAISPARIAAAIVNKSPRQRSTAGKDGRSVVRPQFKNPNGPETWSGRGLTPPKWFADALAAGITKEAMRIREGSE